MEWNKIREQTKNARASMISVIDKDSVVGFAVYYFSTSSLYLRLVSTNYSIQIFRCHVLPSVILPPNIYTLLFLSPYTNNWLNLTWFFILYISVDIIYVQDPSPNFFIQHWIIISPHYPSPYFDSAFTALMLFFCC